MPETDDLELKMKLLRMQRRLLLDRAQKEASPAPRLVEDAEGVVRRVLRERGDEVLEAAKQQYPEETRAAIEELAELVRNGEVTEVTGAWLYSLFKQLGIPVRLKTTIQIISDGKTGTIADKLKEK